MQTCPSRPLGNCQVPTVAGKRDVAERCQSKWSHAVNQHINGEPVKRAFRRAIASHWPPSGG